jgi:hypothetical protein
MSKEEKNIQKKIQKQGSLYQMNNNNNNNLIDTNRSYY